MIAGAGVDGGEGGLLFRASAAAGCTGVTPRTGASRGLTSGDGGAEVGLSGRSDTGVLPAEEGRFLAIFR